MDQVWETIHRSGLRHHRAYDLGMPRLSCALCILAPRKAVLLGARHNRRTLQLYVDAEKKMGHTFNAKWSMADVQKEVESTKNDGSPIESWNM